MKYVAMMAALACLLVAASAQQPLPKGEDKALPPLPPGDARDLIQTDCTSCHNLTVIFQGRKTQAAWAKDVNDMIQRGATVFPEEIDPITSYLSKNFGPQVPQLINVNAATKEQLEKLPTLKPDLVQRILDARTKAGSFKTSEDLRRALGMDKDQFAKDFYLLRYN